jgi:hypothetical protein
MRISVRLTLVLVLLSLSACHKHHRTYPPDQCQLSEWSVGLYRGRDPLHMSADPNVTNPVFSAAQVTDRDAIFTADPFLMHAEKRWYLFFEVMNRTPPKGDIGYAWSDDDARTFKYGKIVISEPFHQSYPYVFKDGGDYYMLPESRAGGGIFLYKATKFPEEWQRVKEIIHGDYADSSIVHYGGKWWIFTTDVPYSFSIFYADSLEGPWTAHPMNHIYWRDKSKGRHGGRLTEYQGKLLRYAQDCRQGYGHSLRVFIVDKLTTDDFAEHEADSSPILEPSSDGRGWRAHSMHTLDPWLLNDGTWLASVDGGGCPPHPKSAAAPAGGKAEND